MSLQQKNEAAFAAYFTGLSFTLTRNIYKASSSPDGGIVNAETNMALPCIIIASERGEHYAPPSANQKSTVRIHIRTQRDDESEAAHQARVDEVANALYVSNLESLLSTAIAAFTCFKAILHSEALTSQHGRQWETTFELDVWSVAAAIT